MPIRRAISLAANFGSVFNRERIFSELFSELSSEIFGEPAVFSEPISEFGYRRGSILGCHFESGTNPYILGIFPYKNEPIPSLTKENKKIDK